MKQLERALSNPQWKLLFEDSHVHHLPRTSSDHHPHSPPHFPLHHAQLQSQAFSPRNCGSMILLSPLSSINLGQNTLEISRQPWMSSLLVSNPGTKILLVTFFIGKKEFLLASQASKNFSTTVTAFSSKNLKLAYKPNINTSFSLRKSFRPLNPVLNGPC